MRATWIRHIAACVISVLPSTRCDAARCMHSWAQVAKCWAGGVLHRGTEPVTPAPPGCHRG
eukprot:11252235-Alexandrium_andersonii.AAC.1